MWLSQTNFSVNLLNQDWLGEQGDKLTEREAAREVLTPSDELPISQMCPNVTPARYLIPGRAFTAANKMFTKCIPRWRDIYQHVDASPASKLPMQSGAEISQGSFGDEDAVLLSYPSPDRHRHRRPPPPMDQ